MTYFIKVGIDSTRWAFLDARKITSVAGSVLGRVIRYDGTELFAEEEDPSQLMAKIKAALA